MIEKINRLREEIEALSATRAEELENLRIKYLSKKEKYRNSSTISEMLLPKTSGK